ncbi:MAG: type II secretion system protein [Candidatus Ozemobacteraceae bacterium]
MRRSGFTLMEILAVASIVAIVAGIAGPATDNFFSVQRTSAEAMKFIQDVRAGRYGAMGTQAYHRILFKADPAGKIVESYVVQTFESPGSVIAIPTITLPVDADSTKVIANSGWTSVLDEEIREISPEITFEKPYTLSCIYMRPDGLLVDQPNENGAPIAAFIATFTYGESVMTVDVNANGIAASSEYYEAD